MDPEPTVKTFQVEIITPAGSEPTSEVSALDVPAVRGRMTVLARHQPYVCTLTGGDVRITEPNGEKRGYRIGPGTMAVARGIVTLLVQHAEPLAAPTSGAWRIDSGRSSMACPSSRRSRYAWSSRRPR